MQIIINSEVLTRIIAKAHRKGTVDSTCLISGISVEYANEVVKSIANKTELEIINLLENGEK